MSDNIEEQSQKLAAQADQGQRSAIALKELADAMDALEADCFDLFASSDIHDDKGRLACRLYLKVLLDVKERFELAINTGEAARKQLIEFNREKDDSRSD